jgi:two-component system, NtrC family, sensor kinase
MRKPSSAELPAATSRGAVLVVDDVEANLTAMDALLSDMDCDLVFARSGNEALLSLLKRDFAMVLLDVQMPEMDGYEVARYARENPATRDVPIVFLTAGGTAQSGLDSQRPGPRRSEAGLADANVLRGYGSGAVDFLFKPVNPTILRSKVQVFLELARGRRELLRTQSELTTTNLELRQAAADKAALAERFQQANVELERAYHDLKAAQTGLIQAAKMASLGELVAGIAHEINNPLSYCVSHVETVKRCLSSVEGLAGTSFEESGASQHWERAQSRLRDMSTGLARITDLVLKLRTFSRLDEGEMKRVDVKECIDSVLTILGHRLSPRIRVSLETHPPERIECNPALFNQALMNLMSNAIDAIPGEGVIGVSSGAVGNMYRLVVQDSGSGIDPKLRDRIFEPFFTTKPVGVGTGLGLSIAYSIVQKHGGTLDVEDAPGGGTRMVLQIPLPGDARSPR